MPNGKPGDSPLTDIVWHGLTVFGHEVDQLILELFRAGAGPEIALEFDLWTKRSSADMLNQLNAIGLRRHRSRRIRFDWAFPAVTRMPNPDTHGWSYTTPVVLSDPAGNEDEGWTMVFHIDPSRFAGDGHKTAVARFLSDEAPWDKLVTGRKLWMLKYGRQIIARGEVMPPDDWDRS